MNILYLTPASPELVTGGGRHCYANLRSLCEYGNASVDYVGPLFNRALKGIERNNLHIVAARNFTPKDRFIAAIKGFPTSLIQIFLEAKSRIDFNKYDLVFMEFSHLSFVLDYLAPHTQRICCVHNVELDYNNFNCTGLRRIKYFNIHRNESKVVRNGALLLIMHKFDLSRLEGLYNTIIEKYMLHPVCSFNPGHKVSKIEDREKNILFCGSLDSKFNEIGLIEFLNTCWKEIQDCGYNLLVAGRNPSERIIQAVNRFHNTRLIPSPPDMGLIFLKARLLVLPDRYGTGMKLRVAEALSYGVPIVGTNCGLRGYEDVESFGFAVESSAGMIGGILDLLASTDRQKELSTNAFEVWKRKYTFEAFRSRIHAVLDQVSHPVSS